jgi:hypothetical protein
MSVLDRRLARSAMVVVIVALCLFGPSRLAVGSTNGHAGGTVVGSGPAVPGSDHAIAPRPPISLLDGWVHSLGHSSVVLFVVAALAWTLVVAERRRVAVAPLAASWRRRGPPVLPS